MSMKMMGKKQGMTQLFDKEGNVIPCTLIHVEPHVVVAIRTQEKEGYNALQLGIEKIAPKHVSKPLLTQFQKKEIAPRRHLAEARVAKVDGYSVGQELDLSLFSEVAFIDVTGVSKGKGFQGVIKRHGFAGGPAAHGSGFHRHGGSCGQRSTPGRTFPGLKKAGHMGHETVTVQGLRVVGVDVEKQVLVVEGAIPGFTGGLVYFAPSRKKLPTKKPQQKKK